MRLYLLRNEQGYRDVAAQWSVMAPTISQRMPSTRLLITRSRDLDDHKVHIIFLGKQAINYSKWLKVTSLKFTAQIPGGLARRSSFLKLPYAVTGIGTTIDFPFCLSFQGTWDFENNIRMLLSTSSLSLLAAQEGSAASNSRCIELCLCTRLPNQYKESEGIQLHPKPSPAVPMVS